MTTPRKRDANSLDRIRAVLPSDVRLWQQRSIWLPSQFCLANGVDATRLRRALAERGWELMQPDGRKRLVLSGAPCRECGATFPIDGRLERVCDGCTPEREPEPWRELYELERAKQEEKRRARREAVSQLVKDMVERQGDPLRKKPGRPRNRRSA